MDFWGFVEFEWFLEIGWNSGKTQPKLGLNTVEQEFFMYFSFLWNLPETGGKLDRNWAEFRWVHLSSLGPNSPYLLHMGIQKISKEYLYLRALWIPRCIGCLFGPRIRDQLHQKPPSMKFYQNKIILFRKFPKKRFSAGLPGSMGVSDVCLELEFVISDIKNRQVWKFTKFW